MKLVNAELLQKRWQNTRNPFVGPKMKKDDASGIGTILLTSSGSSSSLIGSTNSPISKTKQKCNKTYGKQQGCFITTVFVI